MSTSLPEMKLGEPGLSKTNGVNIIINDEFVENLESYFGDLTE